VTCTLSGTNLVPGSAISEVLTITNDSGAPFTLALRADGTENQLWNDLELGVWQAGTAAPEPLPDLLWWTNQSATLATLQDGQSISFEVELYLPTTAGNADQGLTASIALNWIAQG
jgi:hypothetical protein